MPKPASPRNNCHSPRAGWQPGNAMAAHDRLPPELRAFMIHADLPWSARSALALWRRALGEGKSRAEALDRVRRAAAATLAREARTVWGPDHPAAGPAQSARTVTSGRSVSASPSAR